MQCNIWISNTSYIFDYNSISFHDNQLEFSIKPKRNFLTKVVRMCACAHRYIHSPNHTSIYHTPHSHSHPASPPTSFPTQSPLQHHPPPPLPGRGLHPHPHIHAYLHTCIHTYIYADIRHT